MLFDDGLDIDTSKVKGKPKSQVNMNDLYEVLEVKYEGLKEKLMMEMAKHGAGKICFIQDSHSCWFKC